MHRFFIVFLLTFQFTCGAEIEKSPSLIIDGIYQLVALKSDVNSTVNWRVNRYLIDEQDGDKTTDIDYFTTEGDTVNFIFTKTANKLTYFKVYVVENGITDSVQFQVFNKGIRQQYIYKMKTSPFTEIAVHIVVPSAISSATKFVMVMHGTDRNADDYVETWKDFANENDYIAAAPEFDATNWPGSRCYNLGRMFQTSSPYTYLIDKEEWSFYQVQEIHRELVEGFGLADSTYAIWGHSAGAQFIHRMMFFCPDKNINKAIAANAGWYTLPDLSIEYPWGLNHDEFSYDEEDIFNYTYRNLIIMRGTADTLRDSNLNTSELSDAQGRNRYERAGYFFNNAFEIDASCKWQLIDVEGVGHSEGKMAPAAQDLLLNVTTSVKHEEIEANGFYLSQNYPNPFNPSTTIRFTIPAAKYSINNVSLKIYDILGNEVATLINEPKQAGQYEIKFNASSVNLSSGVYFYRLVVHSDKLTAGQYNETKKFILLK